MSASRSLPEARGTQQRADFRTAGAAVGAGAGDRADRIERSRALADRGFHRCARHAEAGAYLAAAIGRITAMQQHVALFDREAVHRHERREAIARGLVAFFPEHQYGLEPTVTDHGPNTGLA